MSLHCTWADVMREAAQKLSASGVENAHRDARLLLAYVLGIEPVDVIARDADAIDGAQLADFESAIQRRLAGEPVSRIRGRREFYGRSFIVTRDVLDPRPETELLVDFACQAAPFGGRVLDLGTGSGCILTSILAERADLEGVAVDLSQSALEVARLNAQALGAADRITFVGGDWASGCGHAPFDVVVANPPYIAEADAESLARDVRDYDPYLALFGGNDGLRDIRVIAALGPRLLKPGGWLALEIGSGQATSASDLFAAAGFEALSTRADLSGTDRIVVGRARIA